jgi:hypothetical protein
MAWQIAFGFEIVLDRVEEAPMLDQAKGRDSFSELRRDITTLRRSSSFPSNW